ncbi:hypothetical protein [Methylocella sp.]|uniref:hypothetical protein n=1 Tax=Methylocella sp. TaxID=1978226 RepID=UPI0035B1CF43
MINLLLVGLLLGMALGRFFRVYVLIPGCALAVVLALSGPTVFSTSLLQAAAELAVVLASVQVGYVASLVMGRGPALLPSRRLKARHI